MDAGKSVVKIATGEEAGQHVPYVLPPRAVLLGEALVVYALIFVGPVLHQPIERGEARLTRTVDGRPCGLAGERERDGMSSMRHTGLLDKSPLRLL
jgi:hypothetical protein